MLLPRRKITVNADGVYIFSGKILPFPHLAKLMNTFLRKVGKAMVQIKRDWFDTALENYERGEMYGRWKRGDTSLTGKIIRYL